MAKFTESEKNACEIVSMKRIYSSGTFNGWWFKVKDNNDNIYEWEDGSILENANKSTIQIAVGNFLMTYWDKIPTITSQVSSSLENNLGVGETLG